jgi:hypothetical protein
MKSNINILPLRTWGSIPTFWQARPNTANYNQLPEQEHFLDGWRNVVEPVLEENQRKGQLIIQGNTVTWEIINFTTQEIRQNIIEQAESQRQERISTMAAAIQESQVMETFQAITDDTEALENSDIYPIWDNIEDGYEFPENYKVQYLVDNELVLFSIIQPHAKQSDWNPSTTPALWTKIEFSAGIEVWSQPTGGDGKYPYLDPSTGQPYKVTHNGQTWVNSLTGTLNVWAPGVYGWTLI